MATTTIGPIARLRARRSLDERIFTRWPGTYPALARALFRLPPRWRLRRALMRRSAVSGWSAWARGDLDLMLVRYAPDYHFEPLSELRAVGMQSAYRGHAGIREAAIDVREAWDRMDYTPIEIVDGGDRFVILGHLRLRGGRSGVELESRVGHIYWIERGLIVREIQFADWNEALRAAGITKPVARGPRPT